MRDQLTGDLNPDRFDSLLDVLNYAVDQHGGLPAYRCLGATLNYRELGKLSDRFALYLQQSTALQPGDRIAIQLPNVLQFPVVFFGAVKAGLVVVNTNPLYTEREMLHQFRDSGVKAIVILSNFCAKLQKVLPDTSIETVIVTGIGDLLGWPRRLLVNWGARYLKKMIPPYSLPGAVTLTDVLKYGADLSAANKHRSGKELALILYTGGTTGYAKGVMLSHKNLITNMMQLRARCIMVINDQEDTILAPLPLYHSYAFLFHCLVMTLAGNCSVLIPNPRDLNALVKTLRAQPVQGIVGINTLFLGLLHHPQIKRVDFSSLRFTGAGGMPLNRSVAQQWEALTGCEIFEGYGLTECSPVVSVNLPGHNKAGTVGLAVPETELRVVDDAGVTVGRNARGELWVRGPQVMQGYWNNPEDTATVLTADGWFKTGDYVEIDDEGYIRIVDRKKDMILVSGFNVVPGEIEEHVNRHPDILESAAIGVPDDETGEAVILYVVAKNKSLNAGELMSYCKTGLTGYKRPREIVFVESLPKSIIGKVLRRELRDLYEAQH